MPMQSRFPAQYITNTTTRNLQIIQALALLRNKRRADMHRDLEAAGLKLLLEGFSSEEKKDFERILKRVESTWELKPRTRRKKK